MKNIGTVCKGLKMEVAMARGPLTLLLAGGLSLCPLDSGVAAPAPDASPAADDPTWAATSLAVASDSDTNRAGPAGTSPRHSGPSDLAIVGGAALFELTAAGYSGIASDKPVGAGVLATIASPIVYGMARDHHPASVALVPAAACGALGVFNFILSAGDHSSERLFIYNMIAVNAVAAVGFLVHRAQTGTWAWNGADMSTPSAWSVGVGPVAGAPGLCITRRY